MSKHSQNNEKPDETQDLTKEQLDSEENLEKQASLETGEPNEAVQAEEEPSLEQQIADLEAKLADAKDQYLRKAADFENFRKRMNREKQELAEFANQNLLLDLLPVIDDFERAIKSAETCSSLKSSKEFSTFFEGVVMIEKRLSTQLESKWGLKRFDSEGKPFDPNLHEAIQMEKSAEISEALVKEDYEKGYLLNDRVIRFAKVKVMMPEEGN